VRGHFFDLLPSRLKGSKPVGRKNLFIFSTRKLPSPEAPKGSATTGDKAKVSFFFYGFPGSVREKAYFLPRDSGPPGRLSAAFFPPVLFGLSWRPVNKWNPVPWFLKPLTPQDDLTLVFWFRYSTCKAFPAIYPP